MLTIDKSLPDPEAIIRYLGMQPHPEGGWFVETYRSSGIIPSEALPLEFIGDRNYSTAIFFLLRTGEKSHFHRIRQDEIWHFYLGGSLRLAMISPTGVYSEVRLGCHVLHGELPQYAVPAGYWFAAAPCPNAVYSLVGCTVAPGFDFADFELAKKEKLVKAFPALWTEINEFSMP